MFAVMIKDDCTYEKKGNGDEKFCFKSSTNYASTCYSAQCAVCKVYFSAQPNNLKLILNFQKYYPIEHIFVPACSSARKEHFFKF